MSTSSSKQSGSNTQYGCQRTTSCKKGSAKTERSPFLSAGWGRYQTRGLSFANYDGSSLPREPMGARIGLGPAPSGECPFDGLAVRQRAGRRRPKYWASRRRPGASLTLGAYCAGVRLLALTGARRSAGARKMRTHRRADRAAAMATPNKPMTRNS
jgi:hypothetical protein